MKQKSVYGFILLTLSCVFIFITSCAKRNLEISSPEETVHLIFDWEHLSSEDVKPLDMNIIFYGSDGSALVKNCSSDGFMGTLPLDTYRVLAYNVGSSNVGYIHLESCSSASAYVSPQAGSKYLLQPSCLYGGYLSELNVTQGQPVTTTIKLLPYIRKAKIKLLFTGTASAVSSCNCVLNGLADSLKIATGEYLGSDGAVSFTPSAVSDGYESTVQLFGRLSTARNILGVTLNFIGGESKNIDVDISSALSKLSYSVTSVSLILTIDISGSSFTGFHGTLENWYITDDKNVEAH